MTGNMTWTNCGATGRHLSGARGQGRGSLEGGCSDSESVENNLDNGTILQYGVFPLVSHNVYWRYPGNPSSVRDMVAQRQGIETGCVSEAESVSASPRREYRVYLEANDTSE